MNDTGSIVVADSGMQGQTVGNYGTYGEAQQAVDYLADAKFPVEYTEIVGRDLSFVEKVTGRITAGRAVLAGAGSGAWFGLFIGLLVGLFTAGPVWLGLVLGGVLIGAFWGAVFALVVRWATGGTHDFASARALAAERYELMVAAPQAERAQQLLSRMA